VNLYQVYPTSRVLDAERPEADGTLSEWFAPQGATVIRWAVIATPGGEMRDGEGHSLGLSNPVDRKIFRTLRGHADAVITGANTVRAEPVAIPPTACLVIVSRHGDLSTHRITAGSYRPGGVIILTGPQPTHEPTRFFDSGVARHVELPHASVIDAKAIVRWAHSEGFRSLLLEGGMELVRPFLDAQLVDECVLTMTRSPLVESHPPLPWWEESWGQWSASAVFTDDARYLYTRYHAPLET
jgi:riboflavin biosynthesis pyrimidine reductase